MTGKRYKQLGKYIELVQERNKGAANTNLMGVSIAKKFIPSIANIIGTDLSSYRIVHPGNFAFCPVTSRNGDKITIARYRGKEDCIISQAYLTFRVKDENELDPEYLMMWVARPEFDRYARFHSHGSVREIFSWEEMCNVYMPIPDIGEQRKIVAEYKTIEKSIENNNRFIKNLENIAETIFKNMFPNYLRGEMRLGDLFTPCRGKNIIVGSCVIGKYPVIAAGIEPATYHNQCNTESPVITISSSGANAGFVRLNRQKVWASDCSFIDKRQFYYLFFAYTYLKILQNKIFSMQEGTGQPHIYPDHIKSIEIGLVSEEKIAEYNDKVTCLYETIFATQEENETLKKIKPLLLSKLS